jgi:hypothetical protein
MGNWALKGEKQKKYRYSHVNDQEGRTVGFPLQLFEHDCIQECKNTVNSSSRRGSDMRSGYGFSRHEKLLQTEYSWRMPSSEILRRVALLRTDVSEERIASFMKVTRIGELRTVLAVSSNRSTLWRKVIQYKIWGFHGGDYEEWCLLGCYAVWLL